MWRRAGAWGCYMNSQPILYHRPQHKSSPQLPDVGEGCSMCCWLLPFVLLYAWEFLEGSACRQTAAPRAPIICPAQRFEPGRPGRLCSCWPLWCRPYYSRIIQTGLAFSLPRGQDFHIRSYVWKGKRFLFVLHTSCHKRDEIEPVASL